MAAAAAASGDGETQLPDDVVDEILIRLPSRSSLARAAASCSAFRALVSSPRFLRRHRARHPPEHGAPLLGSFAFSSSEGGVFHPASPPHPSASAARAVAAAADFSFSFLPSSSPPPSSSWIVRDHRDGRFLLDRLAATTDDGVFTELAVCDPRRRCEPFLAPPRHGHGVDDAVAFSVVWTARCPRKVVAFVFDSGGGERWRALASPDCFVWSRHRSPFGCPVHAVWNRRFYAHGRFFWLDCLTHRWLVLDTRGAMDELAVIEIPSPSGYWEEHVAVVEGHDGKVGVFAHEFHHAGGEACLHYYTVVFPGENDGDGEPRWEMERTVKLSWTAAHERPYSIRAAVNGSVILEVNHGSPAFVTTTYRSRDVELYRVDVSSFKPEMICRARCAARDIAWAYFGFPPLLSLPTV
uniref:F-box domain-containing protein n=1 Tax=Leersia perrieri TaxID=77586 RepID=A0A0D9VDF0_9ORYZ